MGNSLSKFSVGKVMDGIQKSIELQRTRFELCQKIMAALEKYEGKQITKRLEPALKEAIAPYACHIREFMGRLSIEVWAMNPYNRIGEFGIGHKERVNGWKNPGRVNMEDIEKENGSALEFQERLGMFNTIIPQLPGLIERWNAGVDALIKVREEADTMHPFYYGPFGSVHINTREEGE
jgi:hypothetical protein